MRKSSIVHSPIGLCSLRRADLAVCAISVAPGAAAARPRRRRQRRRTAARLRSCGGRARAGRSSASKCGTCHRPNARGGQGFSGPDLIRSVLVPAGRQRPADRLPHLQSGHRTRQPPIPLTAAEDRRYGTFLHREITYAAERTNYQLQYMMTGNARAGRGIFQRRRRVRQVPLADRRSARASARDTRVRRCRR